MKVESLNINSIILRLELKLAEFLTADRTNT